MCYSRYKRLEYNPREHWRPSEDNLLKELVEQKGEDWPLIATYLKSNFFVISDRSAKQVRDHYTNFLKFDVTRDQWTLE